MGTDAALRIDRIEEMIPLGRKRRVMAAVKAAGADAMVVTSLTDVRYLTGFTGSSAVLVLVAGKATFFTDGRYQTQATAEVDGAGVVIAERNVLKAAVDFAVAAGVVRCGFDAAMVTVAGLEAMRAMLPAKLRKSWLVAMPDLIANLRQVKDEVEQDAMREAAALGCRLFEGVLEHIVPGATEMEVAMALEYMARLEGAEGMSFESIVAGGSADGAAACAGDECKAAKAGICDDGLWRGAGRVLQRYDQDGASGGGAGRGAARV